MNTNAAHFTFAMTITFFATPAQWRRWLARHHARARELTVGFHKVGCGKPSITWPESVDEALCFGWIDGVRRRLSDTSYSVRFTPRRAGSIWSTVNVRRLQALIAARRVRAPGARAFATRRAQAGARYSYERRPERLPPRFAALLKRDARALAFFRRQSASYRRAAIWWVISARLEPTRRRRAESLVALSAGGRLIPQFIRPLGTARHRSHGRSGRQATRGSR